MAFDTNIFDDKNLSDLMKDIYDLSATKREQINLYISKLVKLIKTPDEAAIISPIIKDFMEVAVKNDDSLVKIATITQRLVIATKKASSDDGILTEKEKEQILQNINIEIDELQSAADELDVDEIEAKAQEIEDDLDFMRNK